MMQLRRHPDLPQEPLPSQHFCQAGVEHFQGNITVVFEVAGEINHRHTTVADLALDGVAAEEGSRELVLQVWQSGYPGGLSGRIPPWEEPSQMPLYIYAFIAAAITPGSRVQLAFSSNAVIRRIRMCALR